MLNVFHYYSFQPNWHYGKYIWLCELWMLQSELALTEPVFVLPCKPVFPSNVIGIYCLILLPDYEGVMCLGMIHFCRPQILSLFSNFNKIFHIFILRIITSDLPIFWDIETFSINVAYFNNFSDEIQSTRFGLIRGNFFLPNSSNTMSCVSVRWKSRRLCWVVNYCVGWKLGTHTL